MNETTTQEQSDFNTRYLLIFLLFPLIGVVAAVVTVFADSAAQSTIPDAVEPPGAALEAQQLAPDFRLTDLNGEPLALSDFRGRPVVVNFWATWCGPCRREMPAFATFLDEQGDDGVMIIAVNNGESVSQIQDFFDDIDVHNVTTVLDPDLATRREYGVFNLPTTFFVAPDGTVATLKLGEVTLEDLESFAAAYS
ncbi:MAG: TlpA family protein disulfide reductase [Chloroflexi bacterium]|nr:MAG: TlpA family protein disulfide reductase [Chloroflexota bacterium]